MRMVVTDRHAIGDAHRAGRGVELGLEHERIRSVPPAGRKHRLGRSSRCDLPEAVGLVAEEPSEAGGRVEVRKAQPVDRAVHPDEGCGVQVPDDGVVLDRLAHASFLPPQLLMHGPVLTAERWCSACCTRARTPGEVSA